MYLCVLFIELSLASFNISDTTIGTGKEALGAKVLTNVDSGESLEVVWESGGKTEALILRSPRSGALRHVLQTHGGNATAIRLETHYAGSILLPWANRINNGTYHFFGRTHHLPLNEVVPGVRADALHGFLFNRTLSVLGTDIGVSHATLTLGYNFSGHDTPGWPFAAAVELEYTLRAPETAGQPSVVTITTRVTNTMERSSLPFFNSWHPYFLVTDVAKTRVQFDACGSDRSRAWRHVSMGAGGPQRSPLIPIGETSAWDAEFVIGGTHGKPTYLDDEFSATAASSSRDSCGGYYAHRIVDEGGRGDVTVLFADRSHRVLQIFTGAKEIWGWDAIALEPMTGLADAYNNGEGLRVLAAGETFEALMGVTLA